MSFIMTFPCAYNVIMHFDHIRPLYYPFLFPTSFFPYIYHTFISLFPPNSIIIRVKTWDTKTNNFRSFFIFHLPLYFMLIKYFILQVKFSNLLVCCFWTILIFQYASISTQWPIFPLVFVSTQKKSLI
jgi:hypothetical protein